jgi:hypothetical protein
MADANLKPLPPKAIHESVDKALAAEELRRSTKLDPVEKHRHRSADLTGQPLLGHVRSVRGPHASASDDRDEADYAMPDDHPTRDSE